MKLQKLATLIAFSAVAALPSRAQYTQIDLSPLVNTDMQTYFDGANYPLGGTQLTIGGVPFKLATVAGNPATTGIVQTPRDYSGLLYSYVFAVPAGTRATALYSLMDNAEGQAGVVQGSLVVTGTRGETATLSLIDGFNIRDHNEAVFCNTLTDPSVVPTYFLNRAITTLSVQTRLDRQVLTLPGTFAGDTIASITFNGIDNDNLGGQPFVAALTLLNVPEPSVAGMALLGVLVAWHRKALRR